MMAGRVGGGGYRKARSHSNNNLISELFRRGRRWRLCFISSYSCTTHVIWDTFSVLALGIDKFVYSGARFSVTYKCIMNDERDRRGC